MKILGIGITGGLNHVPYLLSISVSLAVIKDVSTIFIIFIPLYKKKKV